MAPMVERLRFMPGWDEVMLEVAGDAPQELDF